MQNAIMNQSAMNTQRIVTAKDVAKECGLATGTVYSILSNNYNAAGPRALKTVAFVKDTAKNMGYDPAMAMKKGVSAGNCGWLVRSASGNFSTRDEETQRMLFLRHKMAMTNPEIADKVGVSYTTVLKRIGPMPKDLLDMSYALRGERIVRRNQARRNVLFKQKIAQFEAFQKEAEAINAKAMELEAQAQKIADEAKAVREQYMGKVVELDVYRKEAEKAAKALGRNLA